MNPLSNSNILEFELRDDAHMPLIQSISSLTRYHNHHRQWPFRYKYEFPGISRLAVAIAMASSAKVARQT
jgi:hypothetical protein